MKVAFFLIFSFFLILAGCEGDKSTQEPRSAGKSSEKGALAEQASPQNGGRAPAPMPDPKRPASKLVKVNADDASKTPLNLARFFLQRVQNKRWLNDGLHKLVVALVESGELEQAAEVALLFSDDGGNSAMSRLTKAAAESGDVKLALKVARWIGSVPYRVRALCDAAEAQAKAGDKQAALATLREASGLMRSVPDKDKASLLISISEAQSSMGNQREAVATCEQALKWVNAKMNDFYKSGYYHRIGTVLIEAGEIQKTKQMIQFGNDLMGKSMSGSARKDIAVLMVEKGELEAALEWVGQFPTRDTPEQQKKDEAYTEIAKLLAKQGKPKRAMEVMNLVKIRIISWHRDLAKLTGAMAEGGDLDEAMKLYQRSQRAADEYILCILATAHFAAGQKERALQLLKQATQKAEEGNFLQIDKHVALETVALAYVDVGEPELAVTVLKKAVVAARVFKKYTNSTKESAVSKRLLDLIATANKVGDEELTAAIMKEAMKLTHEGKVPVYTSTAVKLVTLQDYRRAWETVRLIKNDKSRKGTISQMAKELTRKPVPRSGDTRIGVSTLKKSFTPEEQAFAKQLVDAMQEE